ncbi:rhamnogalacturonan acetylesterase [Paenibacillus doosanensis]|uniref:rhamnogalacturonan acetylesterase n=1 Tax=Paenibacillus doosanensis TaxID=1229154 RepID=UPI00217F33D0|nr:rhamnogalacturonan acetylesterase [Paenibacillus doosanensis]MCS7462601.1 rhamnogalacturonan acetylesterase [Paenibacillus doosanensis]
MTNAIRIYIAGDSTAASYPADQAPMAGWGQMLGALLTAEAEVHNHASCGRSSKSFIAEGRLKPIAEGLRQGDYLFVQFGHNDEKPDEQRHTEPFTTYLDHLMQYIAAARKKGAVPVLFTSVARRHFDADGQLLATHGDYPEAMKKLAAEQDVLLIDMEAKTGELYRKLGPEDSKRLFTWLEPGEHPNYPDGARDNTHFNERGAMEVARIAAAELAALYPGLSHYFRKVQ